MRGLSFEPEVVTSPSLGARQDVVCFVGLVRRSAAPLAPRLVEHLRAEGWLPWDARADHDLLRVPVPVGSWAEVERLFDPERSPGVEGWLAGAVRAFFAQGGRRCWIVRAGDPLPADASVAERLETLREHLVPWPGDVSDTDTAAWRGIHVLRRLVEPSLVVLPDLVELCAKRPVALETWRPTPPREVFVECAEERTAITDDTVSLRRGMPRIVDVDGWVEWGRAIGHATSVLARHRRDVALIAALPLGAEGSAFEVDPLRALAELGLFGDSPIAIGSAFLQLVAPWAETETSARLPGGLVPGDGIMAGVLARRTLEAGCFRSVARAPLSGVRELWPSLSPRARREPVPLGRAELALEDVVSTFERTSRGVTVATDVTTSLDATHRPAAVGRLTSVWLRLARRTGEAIAFEPSGPLVWRAVEDRLTAIGKRLLELGALRGRVLAEALEVAVGPPVTTQNDLDAGRFVATVRFWPAVPVEAITVVLSQDVRGGAVRVTGGAP